MTNTVTGIELQNKERDYMIKKIEKMNIK